MIMELGVLQKIDKDLNQSKRNTSESENLDDDEKDIVSSITNHLLIKKNEKFHNTSTLDWLNSQVRI